MQTQQEYEYFEEIINDSDVQENRTVEIWEAIEHGDMKKLQELIWLF